MEKKQILKVKTLGRLYITNGKIGFPQEKKRSAQVELLIIYLIINRNKDVTNAQLIEFLWPGGSADKPEGALRNLIYRARKEMHIFFEGMECIKSKGRCYYWNPEIECRVDYEEINKLCRKIEQEKEPYRKHERCLEMLVKYKGEVLPEYDHSEWVVEINKILERNCLDIILDTLGLLVDNNLYEEILQICNHANMQRIMDTRIYELKLYAYYKTGKTDMALSFYRQIVDYYYSKYGIEVSSRLKEIYKLVLDTSPATRIDVAELENNLANEENDLNTFYCDFDVFKNIYQINARSAKRSMKTRILSLLTIVDSSGQLNEKEIHQEADILRSVIASSLRKNDVYSKFNMTQYALIIASTDLEGAKVAINRIIEHYNEKKKHNEIVVTNDFKKIR